MAFGDTFATGRNYLASVKQRLKNERTTFFVACTTAVITTSSTMMMYPQFIAQLSILLVVPAQAFLRPWTTDNLFCALPNKLSTHSFWSRRDAQSSVDIVEPPSFLSKIQETTLDAITFRGTEIGLQALLELGEACQQRRPFDAYTEHINADNRTHNNHTLIAKFPQLLTPDVTQKLFSQVESMVQNGWLSQNADSVDGLPSFHLNLVSGGRPVASNAEDDFQAALVELLELVGPPIYNQLLPYVREQLGSQDIQVDDIFIRRYGLDVVDGLSRNGISAHYDVFSRVTSVIALDDTASEGRQGLYTTHTESHPLDTGNVISTTSNHAALRRFFQLNSGDAVTHTWNVLHGVDVEPGIDRTSLIVWFTEKDSSSQQTNFSSPWLLAHPELKTDNVAQFVLASALESSDTDLNINLQDLCLQSAVYGNSFALTRLGSLCEEAGDDADEIFLTKALETIQSIRKDSEVPVWLLNVNDGLTQTQELSVRLSRRFWFEAALCGNPLAQTALADDLMATGAMDREIRVIAASLFGLAAQQGHTEAQEALVRVVQMEAGSDEIRSEEEFRQSPVVKIAEVAMMYQ